MVEIVEGLAQNQALPHFEIDLLKEVFFLREAGLVLLYLSTPVLSQPFSSTTPHCSQGTSERHGVFFSEGFPREFTTVTLANFVASSTLLILWVAKERKYSAVLSIRH